MNTEEKRRIGYIKREDISKNCCSNCVYAFTKKWDPDDRPCRKHNITVGANDICDYFEDWTKVTEEGRQWEEAFQRHARSVARRMNIPYPEKGKEEYNKSSSERPKEKYMTTSQEEKCKTTAQFVTIGSLLGGTMFNLVFAFIAYKTGLMEWGIQQWFFTYVVAVIIVGIGDFLLGILSKDL